MDRGTFAAGVAVVHDNCVNWGKCGNLRRPFKEKIFGKILEKGTSPPSQYAIDRGHFASSKRSAFWGASTTRHRIEGREIFWVGFRSRLKKIDGANGILWVSGPRRMRAARARLPGPEKLSEDFPATAVDSLPTMPKIQSTRARHRLGSFFIRPVTLRCRLDESFNGIGLSGLGTVRQRASF